MAENLLKDREQERASREIVLRFEDVWFSYGAGTVLSAASFHLHDGDFATLVGGNGAGKTTVLKLILGLEHPARGTIALFPEREKTRGMDDIEGLIGYVPQHMGGDLTFPISVREVVEMGRLNGHRRLRSAKAKAADRDAVDEALKVSAVSDLATRPYTALSGGQRRRVLVARALATRPRLLILDEPTANMDVESSSRLYATLEALKGKTTVLIVTHDSSFVSALTDAVFCVGSGEVHNQAGSIVQHRTEVADWAPQDIWGGKALRVLHDETVPCDCDDKTEGAE